GGRWAWVAAGGGGLELVQPPARPAATGPQDGRGELTDAAGCPVPRPPPGGALRFFSACKLTLLSKHRQNFRLYITGTDLLVLQLDPPPFRERRVMAQFIGGATSAATAHFLHDAILGDPSPAQAPAPDVLLS